MRPNSTVSQTVKAGGMATQKEIDGYQAIAQTIAQAAPGDVILLAGKGHEATQEVAGVKAAFSDRAHAEKALQQWRLTHPEAAL